VAEPKQNTKRQGLRHPQTISHPLTTNNSSCPSSQRENSKQGNSSKNKKDKILLPFQA